MSTAEEYTLTYFNKRGGGEIVRLVFAAAGIQYTDSRLDTKEWQIIKPGMPMQSLPVLTVTRKEKSITFCQSGAIVRYLSKKYGLYGTTEEENFLIEEVYDCVGDIRSLFVQRYFSTDAKLKAQLFKKITSTTMPNFSSYFTRRKAIFGSERFIIGSKLSLADLAVFNLIDGCVLLGMEDLLKPYPDLLQHRQDILKIDSIRRWVLSRPNTEV